VLGYHQTLFDASAFGSAVVDGFFGGGREEELGLLYLMCTESSVTTISGYSGDSHCTTAMLS